MAQSRGNVPLVEMRNIHKSFGGIHAVEGVSISVMPGEVVGIVGRTTFEPIASIENGRLAVLSGKGSLRMSYR